MPTLHCRDSAGNQHDFELTTDLNATGGIALPIVFEGVQYWARLGSDQTPIGVKETNGNTYYVQHNPIAWKDFDYSFRIEKKEQNISSYYTIPNISFSNRAYRIEMSGSDSDFNQSFAFSALTGTVDINIEAKETRIKGSQNKYNSLLTIIIKVGNNVVATSTEIRFMRGASVLDCKLAFRQA